MRAYHGSLAAQQRHAFTLIELLVVVSIIAVLASMLLPAVGTIRDLATRTKCGSIVRQHQLANVAYTVDNEGLSYILVSHTPLIWYDWTRRQEVRQALDTDWNFGFGNPWPKGTKCPGIPDDGRYYNVGVYGYNGSMQGVIWGPGFLGTKWLSNPIDKIPRKSEKIAYADGSSWGLRYPSGASTDPDQDVIGAPSDRVVFRHRGRAMAAFWDGHTEAAKPTIFDTPAQIDAHFRLW